MNTLPTKLIATSNSTIFACESKSYCFYRRFKHKNQIILSPRLTPFPIGVKMVLSSSQCIFPNEPRKVGHGSLATRLLPHSAGEAEGVLRPDSRLGPRKRLQQISVVVFAYDSREGSSELSARLTASQNKHLNFKGFLMPVCWFPDKSSPIVERFFGNRGVEAGPVFFDLLFVLKKRWAVPKMFPFPDQFTAGK